MSLANILAIWAPVETYGVTIMLLPLFLNKMTIPLYMHGDCLFMKHRSRSNVGSESHIGKKCLQAKTPSCFFN